jgi:hypothetical protein
LGLEAVDLAAAATLVLDPWQSLCVCDILAVGEDGRWAVPETCTVCQRQDGKGAIIETIELAGLFLFGERLILHSAHEYKTAQEAFLRIRDLIDGCADLSRYVKAIREANGEQQIILMSGARLRFVARSKGSGRGFTGQRNILDEAFALTRTHLAALMPTMSAQPNPQLNQFSTVPDPATMPPPEEAVLPGVRERALTAVRSGIPGPLVYHDWSMQPGEDPQDVDVWYACNPALGIRISEDYVRAELAALGPAKFSIERLGLWPELTGPQWSVISRADWENAGDPESQAKDPVVFSINTSWQRTHTAIAAVGEREDGHLHGVIVEHRPHGDWPIPRMVELACKWHPAAVVLDPSGATNSITDELNKALTEAEAKDANGEPLQVTTLTARQAAAGWGMLYDALSSKPRENVADDEAMLAGRKLRWRSDMHAQALTTSVRQGTKRPLAESFAWECKVATDMSPIKALTDAVYGFVTRPAPVPPVFFGAYR